MDMAVNIKYTIQNFIQLARTMVGFHRTHIQYLIGMAYVCQTLNQFSMKYSVVYMNTLFAFQLLSTNKWILETTSEKRNVSQLFIKHDDESISCIKTIFSFVHQLELICYFSRVAFNVIIALNVVPCSKKEAIRGPIRYHQIDAIYQILMYLTTSALTFGILICQMWHIQHGLRSYIAAFFSPIFLFIYIDCAM